MSVKLKLIWVNFYFCQFLSNPHKKRYSKILFYVPCGNCLILPYLKKGSDQIRSRLTDQKIFVTALIRFVYGPNKLPLLLTKATWSILYLRYPYGPDRILIRSTLLVIRIYCLLLPFVSIFASVWLCHNLFKPA